MNIAGEQLNIGAGISVTNVPYRGAGPAINDLLGGHVDIIIADPPVIYPLVAGKSARALAAFGEARSPLLPDVPTTKELGFPDMLMDNWYGILAPAGLPADVAATLEKDILAALANPVAKERLAAGGLIGTTGREGFRSRLARDFAYWGPQLKKLGITLQP
jgi:tripartite-type tricarboxylate transporter receptor subunit TctC